MFWLSSMIVEVTVDDTLLTFPFTRHVLILNTDNKKIMNSGICGLGQYIRTKIFFFFHLSKWLFEISMTCISLAV